MNDPCGCIYAEDGSRLKHCGKGQQRSYPYTGEPTMHVIKANGWACKCEGLRPRQRHQQPMDCIPAEALASWRRAHEDVTTSDRTARALMWTDLRRNMTDPVTDAANIDDADDFDDSRFVICARCFGSGDVLVCIDDLCRGAGECMHGDGVLACPDCDGEGEVER